MGVPPRTPRSIAAVAVAAVSPSARRSSASVASLRPTLDARRRHELRDGGDEKQEQQRAEEGGEDGGERAGQSEWREAGMSGNRESASRRRQQRAARTAQREVAYIASPGMAIGLEFPDSRFPIPYVMSLAVEITSVVKRYAGHVAVRDLSLGCPTARSTGSSGRTARARPRRSA